MSAAGWLPVSEAALTPGLDVEAHWTDEGGADLIDRVSVRGAGEDSARALAAVQRVMRAYGVDPDVTVTWEGGEGEDEQVALLRTR